MELTSILIIIITNFLLTLSICGILNKQIDELHKETLLISLQRAELHKKTLLISQQIVDLERL